MRRQLPPALTAARPALMLTAGFGLVDSGIWHLFGTGVGLITAGVLTVVLQWWVDSD